MGKPPIFVTFVLLPNQLLGLFLPTLAGWVYDRYNPKWLRPGALASIALGFLLLGGFSQNVAWWGVPLLMLPTYIGSNLFNTANNAVVMNTLLEKPQLRVGDAGDHAANGAHVGSDGRGHGPGISPADRHRAFAAS